MLLIEFFLFVIIRNIVNYVVIPLARLYGVKWIEKHFDDNNKQLSFSETSQCCERRQKKHPSFWTAGCFSYARMLSNFSLLLLILQHEITFKVKKVVLWIHYLGDYKKEKFQDCLNSNAKNLKKTKKWKKNNSQIDDFFRRKNQNLSVYIYLYNV